MSLGYPPSFMPRRAESVMVLWTASGPVFYANRSPRSLSSLLVSPHRICLYSFYLSAASNYDEDHTVIALRDASDTPTEARLWSMPDVVDGGERALDSG